MHRIFAVFRQHLAVLIVPICLASGCGRDDVRVYDVPKEPTQMSAEDSPHGDMASPHGATSPHGMGLPATRPGIHFDVPQGWTEEPADQMRVASFRVEGADGVDADVAVIPLPGVAGQDLQIVNLWREQLKLDIVNQEDLEKMSSGVTVGNESARLFDLVSDDLLIQQKEKARILVAMLNRNGTSWFFKMTGPASLVADERNAFQSFLKSVTFTESPSPSLAGMQGSAAGSVISSQSGGGLPDWQVPQNWRSAPPPNMILAKYVAASAGESEAEITISSFPGDVGGIEANVNRWRRQLGLPGVEGEDLQKLLTQTELHNGGSATVVDMRGASAEQGGTPRMVAAIVPRSGETWFYKLLGPESLVAAEKENFIGFVQSVKYSDAR